MDINKHWRDLEEAKFSKSQLNTEIIMKAIHNESKSTITLLKKRLRAKINWILFFIAAFIVFAIFQRENTSVVAIMMAATGVYVIGLALLWQEYAKMGVNSNFESSALDIMKENLTRIKAAIRKETIWGSIIMPLAIVIGILLSGLMRGKDLSEAAQNIMSLPMIVTILVLAVAVMYGAKKANDYAFGNEIKQLEKQVADLERL